MSTLRISLLSAIFVFAVTAAEADIVVGVAGPMSGSNAAFGEQFKRGAEKAVADINAAGGVLNQKLMLVIGDDACDPKQAVSVANDMAAKRAVFVAGHYCSSSSIPASDVYAESGIIQITPASTAVELTERRLSNVFRVCGRNDQQAPLAAIHVAEHFKGKRVAVVDDKSTFGKGLADEFRRTLNARGMKETLNDSIVAGQRDYLPLVTKLKQARIDVIYFGGYHAEAGLIVRQMRAQNVLTLLVGNDAMVTDEFWSITGPAGEGTLITFTPDPRLDPANAQLVQFFRSRRYEPEAYTLYTYAAVQAWAQAAAKAGTTSAARVSAALKANPFDTVLGRIGFNAKGDVTAPGYKLYVWKAGKYVYVQ
jgi:branched-chain amino acid transport system substrate-binding protein